MNAIGLAEAAQILLALAGLALATWCAVLARRLRRLNDLETGLGGAIAVLAAEVQRLEQALGKAQKDATAAGAALGAAVDRARDERARWALQGVAAAARAGEAPPAPAVRQRLRRVRTGGDHVET